MWNQSGVWAQVSNYQRQQRADTDPGFALATAGREVIHSFQFAEHLAAASTEMILFMTLNSFIFLQVSLCIMRAVENWLIQNIQMIKIPYPCITLRPSFPTPLSLGKLLGHAYFSLLFKYTLASSFTQAKHHSQLWEHAGHIKHFIFIPSSSLQSPEPNRAVTIPIFYTLLLCAYWHDLLDFLF